MPTKKVPYFFLKGTHREVGQQHGENCRGPIARHLENSLGKLRSIKPNLKDSEVEEVALGYKPYVVEYAPGLDEEIAGLAEGAGISLAQAYLLQLRAEVVDTFEKNVNDSDKQECSSVGILAEASQNGQPILAHDMDLDQFYAELETIMEIHVEGEPRLLSVAAAGQISQIGFNQHGLAVCANFVACDSWRFGFPRYLISRLVLQQKDIASALPHITDIRRASSRNYMLMDQKGALDIETSTTEYGTLKPENGILVHTNHYIAASMLSHERSKTVENSATRLDRAQHLLKDKIGAVTVDDIKTVMQDRANLPHAICRHPDDLPSPPKATVVSTIMLPGEQKMLVAPSPPDQHEYTEYCLQ